MRDLVEVVREAWGWCGLDPAEVSTPNAFGNVIGRAKNGAYWRIMPEEPSAAQVAANRAELDQLFADEDFRLDWEMNALVDEAQGALGPRGERCYCLKVPAILGGEYAAENMGLIAHDDLLGAAGGIARQLDALPDGAQVRLRIMD